MKIKNILSINNFVLSSLLIIFIISWPSFYYLRAPLVAIHILFFSFIIIMIYKKLYFGFGPLILLTLFIYLLIQNIVLQTELLFVFQSFLMVLLLFFTTQFATFNAINFLASKQPIYLSKILLLFYPFLAFSFTSWSRTSDPGLFMNPNTTGHISIILIPFLLLGFINKKKFIILIWLISLYIITVLESRSTLLAWLLCLLSYLIVLKFPKINFFLITILVCICTLTSMYAIDFAIWLLHDVFNLLGQYDTRFLYLGYNGRDVIWESALDRFYDEPYFGLGFGGSKFEVDGHKFDTHNGFLEILLRLGLIGTILFSIYSVNLSYMISKSNESIKPILVVSLVAIMSLATNSATFFVFNYLFLYVNILIYAAFILNKRIRV